MKRFTAIWKPAWYELDQSIAVGEIGDFELITTDDFTKFATALEEGEEIKSKILKISNSEFGSLIRIDATGLSYKFYTDENKFYQVEAEETPGKIELENKENNFLKDLIFRVELELLK